LGYINNLHTCPGKQFLRRKSTPVFHPPGGLQASDRPSPTLGRRWAMRGQAPGRRQAEKRVKRGLYSQTWEE
jgi:hypothetical protein